MRILGLALAVALGWLAFAGDAQAAVARVVMVQTSDMPAYLANIEKIRAIQKRLGTSAQLRVWRARFAGDEAGSIVVAIEYPDLATYAANDAKDRADPEFQAVLKDMDRIRKIVSDSIYDELK